MKTRFRLESNFSDSIDVICKKCNELQSECICAKKQISILPKTAYKVKSTIAICNGKKVSSFYPLYIDNANNLLKDIKKKLGCGGNIEQIDDYQKLNLQGDKISQASRFLSQLGFNIDIND